MSLLIQYCCIPLYFCFSIIFSPSLIHCHAPHWCDLPHNTGEPSWLLTLALIVLYTTFTITSLVYQMDRWPADLVATFPFLGTSHTVSFILIPFPAYQFHTTLHDGSNQLPNLPCHRPTGHKLLHHVVRESGDLLPFHQRWALHSISQCLICI